MSSLRLAEGSSNGGDEVGTNMGKGDGLGGGAGVNTGEGGDSGSDREGIWGSGEDYGESSDDGGVDIARSLETSASDHTGVGTGAGIEILAVTRYAGMGVGEAADSSFSKRLSLLRR
ncbi:hypothetical protein Tco_0740357 [Tanacetum coccineum]